MPKPTKVNPPQLNIIQHFASLEDRRVEGRTVHPLITILVTALCAVLTGADGWQAMADFAEDRKDWLGRFLPMPRGVPSESTFRRVLSALSPKSFAACVRSWVQSLAGPLDGQVVAFDGKTLKGALRRMSWGQCLHQVHVWAVKQRLLLAHAAVDHAPDEPAAMRQLLELISLPGAIVTGDAIHCSRPTAQAVLDSAADYVLQLKGNRSAMHRAVDEFFSHPPHPELFAAIVEHDEREEYGHGRYETRKATSVPATAIALPGADWPGLASLTQIERTRIVEGEKNEQRHYYASSLPAKDVRRIATAAREHWGVENQLHWILDVQMCEDTSAVYNELGAQNLATLRRVALQMLQRDTTYDRGIKARQAKASRNVEYLEHVLKLGIS